MDKNKKVRLYYMGKRQKDIYLHLTKWEIFKRKFIDGFKKTMYTLGIIGFLSAAFHLGAIVNPNTVYAIKEKEVVVDNLTAKVNELKAELVNDIKKCESSNISEDSGLIKFDPHRTNKKVEEASIGLFQFKKATVTYYYKSLYKKDITGKEAVEIALSEKLSSKLATDIIFQTEKGLDNWLTCSKKTNAYEELKLIKKLME